MFILPYAHERQTVQRLPWITFWIIWLNVLIFFILLFDSSQNEAKQQEKFKELIEYYTQHPYLEFPHEMKQYYNLEDNRYNEVMKEMWSYLSADIIQKEQSELNRYSQEFIQLIEDNPSWRYGYKPAEPHFFKLITSLFVHGGFLHLIGNMLFLYLAGASIEDLWGRPLFLFFYLSSGIAATLTHQLRFETSPIPLIGASGAIAGLMGAFLFRLYKTRIRFAYFIWVFLTRPFMGTFAAPAFIMLPLWLWSRSFTPQ